MLDSIIDS
ncbi:ee0bbdce-837d-45d9-a367-55cae9dc4693 [Thermothielavioides terrestris]|uniref:Ee0bbdce-837d-45d9-a367-55cae9dc4693 n=1 Tax=Thermothielavioides terrestris TaxID=2587410 RepID=A0A446BTI0_9PEZI|nr:ee0bbdce-837d-45d9-a367-55cae9dc4693 [Thermothielavioides terrestris]